MNIKEINQESMFGNLTNEQLSSVIDAVKYAKSRLQKATIRGLQIGDNVNFTSSKTGQNVTGFVTKVAIKYVTVRTSAGLWKVPANMLTLVREYA